MADNTTLNPTSSSTYPTVDSDASWMTTETTTENSSDWTSDIYQSGSSDETEPSGESDYTWEDDELTDFDWDDLDSMSTESADETETAASATSVDSGITIIDNQFDPEVDFVKPSPETALPIVTKVYLPQNSADRHRLKINAIPNSYTVSASAGSEENSLFLEVKDEAGVVVARYEVYSMENNYVQLSGGADLIVDDSLNGSPLSESIYFNSEPAQTVTETLDPEESKELTEQDLKNGNTFTYTMNEGAEVTLSAPEGSTYTVNYTKESDSLYTMTLQFYDANGDALSTVTLHKVTADIEDMESMSHVDVANAQCQNESDIQDTNVQLVLEMTTLEALGHVVDEEGTDLGVPSQRVKTLMSATGKTALEILTIFKSKIGRSYDGESEITMEDVNRYLENVNEPSGELVEFLEAMDPSLQAAHQLIYEHIDDAPQTTKEPFVTATYASQTLLDAQAQYRDRFVALISQTFSDKVKISKSEDKVGVTIRKDAQDETKYPKNKVTIYPGSECDDFRWNGKTYDLIDIHAGGDISLDRAVPTSDLYSLTYAGIREIEEWGFNPLEEYTIDLLATPQGRPTRRA